MKLVLTILILLSVMSAQVVVSSARSKNIEDCINNNTDVRVNIWSSPRFGLVSRCIAGAVHWFHRASGSLGLSDGKVIHSFYIEVDPNDLSGLKAIVCPKNEEATQSLGTFEQAEFIRPFDGEHLRCTNKGALRKLQLPPYFQKNQNLLMKAGPLGTDY